jgi:hypothetical protein
VSDETRRRLEQAGSRPVPQPDPEFAERLEARLLAVAATSPVPPEPTGPVRSPGRRRRSIALALAALSALAVVLAVTLGTPNSQPGPAPLLAGPVNVTVALTDGTVVDATDGLSLPDGAVVTVGEGGYARIGDQVLHAGDVVTIESGRPRIDHDRPIGVVTQTPGHATSRPTTRPTTRPTSAPNRTPRPTAPPTPKPTPKTTPAPDRTPKPTSTPEPTPTPTPPVETGPPPTPSPSPVPLTFRPRLRAHANPAGDRVVLRWTATRRAASYLLIVTRSRVGPAPDPVYPGSQVFRQFAAAPDHWLRFRVLDPVVEVKVMVVALGPHGHEVSRSRIVTVRTGGDVTGEVPAGPDPPPDDGGGGSSP